MEDGSYLLWVSIALQIAGLCLIFLSRYKSRLTKRTAMDKIETKFEPTHYLVSDGFGIEDKLMLRYGHLFTEDVWYNGGMPFSAKDAIARGCSIMTISLFETL